jgi:hypothetical protein
MPRAPIRAQVHDPPRRVPETALRDAVVAAHAATMDDGRDRFVVFDVARRRIRVEPWPLDERPGLKVLATIGPDPDAP